MLCFNMLFAYAKNKAAEQADQHLLCFASQTVQSLVLKIEISSTCLASVTKHAGLCLTWSEMLKTGFLTMLLNDPLIITLLMFELPQEKTCLARKPDF